MTGVFRNIIVGVDPICVYLCTIIANQALKTFFGKCRSGEVRVVKISIENEELCLDEYREALGTWEEDYDMFIKELLVDVQPCYVLYRLDSQNDIGYEWILLSWSPDDSPVREKMLYASTKATLKAEFGGSLIKDDLFGSTLDEVSLAGYYKFKTASKNPAPLTFAEEELKLIRQSEAGATVGVDSKCQTIQGVALPISDATVSALFDLRERVFNYLQMSIDLDKEEINLETTKEISLSSLRSQVPTDKARYHIFRFDHTHEGDFLQSFVFIYSMPGYACPVKERMLYSSCKNPLLDAIENKIAIPITKKVEIDSGRELTEEFLMEELHPKLNIYRPKFPKPQGPPNRGARRITKPQAKDVNESVFV